jgi:hypothetical protein
MDIVTPREGRDGKTFWNKIGVAFETQNGGWALTFEALPIPTLKDGKLEVRALLMPPRDGDARQTPRGEFAQRTAARARDDDYERDVPF